MTERSARFDLPFLLPGQAQKEHFHNEAILALDGLVHAAAVGEAATPPPDPATGACWLVAAGASGAWAGRDGALALWTVGGWRLLGPRTGMQVWDEAAGFARRWTGTAWSDGTLPVARLSIEGDDMLGPRQPDVPSPSGGTTIDVQARAAVDALIVTLKSHGLID